MSQATDPTRAERTCPYCAETIKAEAVKCRFCGEFLPAEATAGSSKREIPESAPSSDAVTGPVSSNAGVPITAAQPKGNAWKVGQILLVLALLSIPIYLKLTEPSASSTSPDHQVNAPADSSPAPNAAGKDARPEATPEQISQMAKMGDSALLNRADRLLAGTNVSQISRSHEDEAAMYLREFDHRHPDSNDKHAKKAGDRLAVVTLTRNISDRAAALDADPPRFVAQVECQATVQTNLKAPSTAVFRNNDYVKYLGKGKFHIQTEVDAQNSFGAKLRSTFDCQVQCLDKEHCVVTKLKEL